MEYIITFFSTIINLLKYQIEVFGITFSLWNAVLFSTVLFILARLIGEAING